MAKQKLVRMDDTGAETAMILAPPSSPSRQRGFCAREEDGMGTRCKRMLGGCSGDETDAKWKGGKRNRNGPVQLIARLDVLCVFVHVGDLSK